MAKHRLTQFAAHMLAKAFPQHLLYSPSNLSMWDEGPSSFFSTRGEPAVPPPSVLPPEMRAQPSKIPGIHMRDSEQRALLETLSDRFKSEYDAFPRVGAPGDPFFHLNNGWFEKVDAEMLYAVVRYLRPSRIVEIGTGITSMLSAAAIARNQSDDPAYDCAVTGLEPGQIRFVPESLDVFRQLKRGDILFIDSSHVSHADCDVDFQVFEILPHLEPGVWIHFHDIFLPWEYPRSWSIGTRRFLNEQNLLQAFLSFNPHFEVVWGSYYMLQNHPRLLENAFASFREDVTPPGTFLPGSFWIQRVA